MINLYTESLFVAGMLAGLGLAGGFVVLPFRKAIRFVAMTAPLAGSLTVVLGSAALYSISRRDFVFCAAVSFAICVVATALGIAFIRPKFHWRSWVWPILAFLIIVPAVTYATDATTIRRGAPAFLYMDGTDHLGYAQMADWLCTRPADVPPRSDAKVPYEAFPYVLFRQDPRFGSFFSLTLIRTVRGLSGTFSYDIACAVILSAGILAVAGTFCCSIWSCIVLLAGLLTCHWYDYCCGGYFGKLLGYPASLFVAGLVLSGVDLRSPFVQFSLVLLTAATATMHAGTVTAFFLAALLFGFVACKLALSRGLAWSQSLNAVATPAAVAAMLIVVSIVATGAAAKPNTIVYPDWGLKWSYVLPRMLDIENQGVSLTFLKAQTLGWMTVGSFMVWLALIWIAIRRRDAVAGGILIGPFAVFLLLFIGGGRAAAFQMIGTFYPFMMCGAVFLIDRRGSVDENRRTGETIKAQGPGPGSSSTSAPPRRRLALTVVCLLAVISVVLRIPRTLGGLKRYTGPKSPPSLQFSKEDSDRLTALIGAKPVEIDVIEPQRAIFLLVELGRRQDDIHLRWSPRSWKTTVGYTTWPAPIYDSPALLRLVAAGQSHGLPTLFQSPQYELLDCSGKSTDGVESDKK